MFDPFYLVDGSFPSELGVFISLAFLLAVASVLAAGRRDPDPKSLRPMARYLGAACVLTLFITLFAAFGAVQSMTDLMVNHKERAKAYSAAEEASYESDEYFSGVYLPITVGTYDFSYEKDNNGNYSVAVATGLIVLTTGALFAFHARARRRLIEANTGSDVVERIERTTRYAMCGVAGLVAAVALTSSGFGIWQVIAPGIAIGSDADVTRMEGVSEFLSFLVLAALAWWIFRTNWRKVGPTHLFGRAPKAAASKRPAKAAVKKQAAKKAAASKRSS